MATKAQIRANNKYKKNHCKRIVCEVPKDYYSDIIEPYLKLNGYSTSMFIKKCIVYAMQHPVEVLEDEK